MSVAVLSPHFDDAVLSCWHLLGAPDDEVVVLNVCTASPPAGTSVPAWDRLSGARDPVVRMAERRAEDRRALALAGREAVHLGLLDQQYDSGPRSTPALVALLESALPPSAVVYAPAGLGGHPDHELVRDAALALARRGRRVVLYADLPHAIRHGWPAWVSGADAPAGTDVAALWATTLAGAGLVTERLVPRVRALDTAARARKLGALAEYRTQRAALDRLAFAPLEDPRALAFEVSWVVPASALGRADEPGDEAGVGDGAREALHDRR